MPEDNKADKSSKKNETAESNIKTAEKQSVSLQSEFERLQKNIDEQTLSVDKRSKDLEKKEKDLEEKEKRSRSLSEKQIVIPVIIYVLMIASLLIFGTNSLIPTTLILVIGIIIWAILTLQYYKIQKTAS